MNQANLREDSTSATEPSLLIVDDAQMMRLKIQLIAEAAGWKSIVHAPDGQKAIELYRLKRFSLVTMDLVMPGVDGLEALRAIRADDPEARVVMVSAVNQREKLINCISAGAMDFIVKPFDPARLQHFLEDRYQLAWADSTRYASNDDREGSGQ